VIVYHGSYVQISKPDLIHSRKNVDFGKGFYTTPIYEQAKKWCIRHKYRRGIAFISKYTFDEAAFQYLNVIRFDSYSEEWLNFILNCRSGNDSSDYDIVIGGVANDRVFNTVELFFDGLIDKNEAIKRLSYEKPNLQICFRTERAINTYLHYEGSEQM